MPCCARRSMWPCGPGRRRACPRDPEGDRRRAPEADEDGTALQGRLRKQFLTLRLDEDERWPVCPHFCRPMKRREDGGSGPETGTFRQPRPDCQRERAHARVAVIFESQKDPAMPPPSALRIAGGTEMKRDCYPASMSSIVGIANEHSIAFGVARRCTRPGRTRRDLPQRKGASALCARWARSLAVPRSPRRWTRRIPTGKRPLPRIAKEWGGLDIVVHSIAFAPRDDLQGRVVGSSAGLSRWPWTFRSIPSSASADWPNR